MATSFSDWTEYTNVVELSESKEIKWTVISGYRQRFGEGRECDEEE
jgi:hypothetical protein